MFGATQAAALFGDLPWQVGHVAATCKHLLGEMVHIPNDSRQALSTTLTVGEGLKQPLFAIHLINTEIGHIPILQIIAANEVYGNI